MASQRLSTDKPRTKTQELRLRLLKMIKKKQPHSRLPTMRALCESLRVSPMTLHRAMSQLEVEGVIYRRQGSGTYVAPRVDKMAAEAGKTVGLVYDRDVFSAGTSPFGGLLVEAARRWAERHDERFSVYLAMPSAGGLPVHRDLVEALEQRRLQGVLFVGEQNPAALEWLLQQDVPVVALAYTPIAPHRVKIDHAAAVELGVEALAAQGCHDIGLWIPVGVGIGRAGRARSFPELDAFRKALKRHGLPYKPELVWHRDELTDRVPPEPIASSQKQGLRAVREVFGEGAGGGASTRPDGLIIDDDMMTRGALTGLARMGIQPGRELRIATHTNRGSTVLAGHEDDLTLIEVDPEEIASAMFTMLETLMAGSEPASPVVAVKPRLKQRA